MRPRDVLARNLEKLMAATPALSTFPQITSAGGGSNGTLDRIRRKQIATGVDNLAPLAAAYGLQAWELLVPTLAAAPGTDVRPVISGDATELGRPGTQPPSGGFFTPRSGNNPALLSESHIRD
jgi:hypothetical protein